MHMTLVFGLLRINLHGVHAICVTEFSLFINICNLFLFPDHKYTEHCLSSACRNCTRVTAVSWIKSLKSNQNVFVSMWSKKPVSRELKEGNRENKTKPLSSMDCSVYELKLWSVLSLISTGNCKQIRLNLLKTWRTSHILTSVFTAKSICSFVCNLHYSLIRNTQSIPSWHLLAVFTSFFRAA